MCFVIACALRPIATAAVSRDWDAGFALEELAQMRRGEMDCVRHFSERHVAVKIVSHEGNHPRTLGSMRVSSAVRRMVVGLTV